MNCNITSLTKTPELSVLLASFLTPADSFNFLLTSKEVLSHGYDNEENQCQQSRFMNVSLRQSLLSVMKQRPEFSSIDINSFFEGIRAISSQSVKRHQVAIAGSLIVQAIISKGNPVNDDFKAGDIDIFTTAEVLSFMRKLLVEFGFVLTGVSTTYRVLNSNQIHHVESYSLALDQSNITTVRHGIRATYNLSRVEEFLFSKTSPYAILPDFPFSKDPRGPNQKHIDLVVTSAATVNDTISNFDISMCKANFNGVTFTVPSIGKILARETRLTCPKWTLLLDHYASLYLSEFENFWPIPRVSRFPDFSPTRLRVDFARQCIQHVYCDIPDWGGIFRPPPEDRVLSNKYVITLHNMLVRISKRIIKYSKRGFDFTDITVEIFNRKRKYENTATDPANAAPKKVSRFDRALHCTRKKPSCLTDPVKRVKITHGGELSSPAFRVKLRHLDTNGVVTTPFYEL